MPDRPQAAVSAMGAFLSSRRALVDPSSVGVVVGSRRRVAGLRREEVAVRAGVSIDYYTRLEQGREQHPSAQVLDALATALDLEKDAREHLHRLAGSLPVTGDLPPSQSVGPELRRLLGEFRDSPALVLGRTLDVLARNDLCEALHDGFTIRDNSARMVFLDPLGRTFYDPWEVAAEASVSTLRLAEGLAPEDPALRALVAELVGASAEFTDLWRRQVVRAKTAELKRFRHARAGSLAFAYQSFDVRGVPGQQLVVFGSLPGDTSVARLRALGA